MELLGLLLNDWTGRLTLFVILFCVGMLAYIGVYATRQVLKSESEAPEEGGSLDPSSPGVEGGKSASF